jgi:PLP dependent protein
LPVLLEFNVGGEESKGGWEATDEARWSELLGEVSEVLALPNLQVRGLMTMPPLGEDG